MGFTKRFRGLPSFSIGNLHLVWGFTHWKFGVFKTPVMQDENGTRLCTSVGCNIGKAACIYESPVVAQR